MFWPNVFLAVILILRVDIVRSGKPASKMSAQRLAALRSLMANQPRALQAYIIPTADAHDSEYIAPTDARREWISGFTGSAGTAIVTSTQALCWTDGRYYTQFVKQTDGLVWTLMKQSLPGTPSMEKWLSTHLPEGSIVGADPKTVRRDEWTPWKTVLAKANIELVAIPHNLVDEVRVQLNDPPPPRPANPLLLLPLKYTGKECGQKVAELREKMVEKKASALVITALDEVAYTLNLRGSDIEYNPVFFSYLVIRPDSVILFWNEGVLSTEVEQHFEDEGLINVMPRKYEEVFAYLEEMAIVHHKPMGATFKSSTLRELSQTEDSRNSIWLSHSASEAIHTAAAGGEEIQKPLELISEVSPVALAKQTKNEVELQGFRDCHIRDGTAVIRFFRWLHEEVNLCHRITELQAAEKLLEFRSEEADFMGPSFETIAGAGANGAIIHYTPSKEEPQTVIESDQMFLLDSGGQYRDGTTDITRTRYMNGKPSAEQKAAFTRVLKGQIMISSALFPKGVKGNVLDSFARKALWDVGLDYAHGTGHGVGHFLNVHEGPSGVSWRPYPDDPGLTPGQILSNEPGYYKVGAYGIRHEDLIEIVEINKDSNHPKAKNLVGDYEGRGVLGFNTVTVVPNQRAGIDLSLLDDFELAWINAYHARVLDTVGPHLKRRGLTDDYNWLLGECSPIVRDVLAE